MTHFPINRLGFILFVYLHDFPTECDPEWSFQRMDGHEGTISRGFNFRDITYDTDGQTRYLTKLIGIRFVFFIEGTAGRFSITALTLTLGGM